MENKKAKKKKKNSKNKKKLKEISWPMKFNPGTLTYEPRLPLKKSQNKKIPLKKKLKWIFIVILMMILFSSIGLFYVLLNR